jgi:hypothetical protein
VEVCLPARWWLAAEPALAPPPVRSSDAKQYTDPFSLHKCIAFNLYILMLCTLLSTVNNHANIVIVSYLSLTLSIANGPNPFWSY